MKIYVVPEALKSACERNNLAVVEKETRFEWFVYEKTDDEDEQQERQAARHLHVFFTIEESRDEDTSDVYISKILPKNSNWREGEQIDLTDYPTDEWLGQVAVMDETVKTATRSFIYALNHTTGTKFE